MNILECGLLWIDYSPSLNQSCCSFDGFVVAILDILVNLGNSEKCFY